MKEIVKFNTKKRLGGWFPTDESMLEAFRLNLVEHIWTANLRLHPEVEK